MIVGSEITILPAFGPAERELLSLPACLGGLGVLFPLFTFFFIF